MNRYLAVFLISMFAYTSSATAQEPFSIYDITLGADFNEAVAHLQSLCPQGCPGEASTTAGVNTVTVYQRFTLIRFSNTNRVQVDTAKPYQQVSVTRGLDNRVLSIKAETYGDPISVRAFVKSMAAAYDGKLQEFIYTNPNTNIPIEIKSDLSTDQSIEFFSPNLKGIKFQIAQWKLANGALIARLSYTDYDALAKSEEADPTGFNNIRKLMKLPMRRDGAAGLTPRVGSNAELAKALKYTEVQLSEKQELSDAGVQIKIIKEKNYDPGKHASQILVNGKIVSEASFFKDGMAYESVQKLSGALGLYWIHAGWFGNGCDSQQELLLSIKDGKGYLSEPFGRCDTSVTVDKGTYYFNYAATEYEPPATYVIQ